MVILNDFSTSVRKSLEEIDPDYDSYEALVVCGTHNQQNPQEMIEAITIARKLKIPALLICAGHQLGAIEYAQSLGIKDATSEEFGEGTFIVKKRDKMKVGLHEGESWWTNYEVDPAFHWEVPSNWVSVPYHPEYQSSKDKPHKDLVKFIELCK